MIDKRILVGLCVITALIGARVLFPEVFQCQSPECRKTHKGEP